MKITLLLLSWNRHPVLLQTLKSYSEHGLLNLIKDKIIYFQQFSDKDLSISEKYNLKSFGTNENVGIGPAIKFLIDESKTEYILFLENDWLLIENENIVKERLNNCIQLLETNQCDFIKLRHTKYPGNPVYSEWIKGKELTANSTSYRHLLDCCYWYENPIEHFPNIISKVNDIYLCDSKYANYSNNPFICKTSFAKEHILPFCHVDGKYGLESHSNINDYWESKHFIVGHSEGLFAHKDYV